MIDFKINPLLASKLDFKEGDLIEFILPDPNRWRRFWRFITFRSPPTIRTRCRIGNVHSATEFTVE